MKEFIKKAPKLELHAHLNGSLTTKTFLELGKLKYGNSTEEFNRLCQDFKNLDKNSLDDCFKKFGFAHGLTATAECLRYATMCVIRDFAEDNVIYLELRTNPKANASMTKVQYLECVLDEIIKAKTIYPDILVKLLPSINRSQSSEEAMETVAIVISLLEKYPNLIPGIDLSGNPSIGCFSQFTAALEAARNAGLKLALHCGEVENCNEIEEMIRFGMDRCGHGTFIKDANLNLLIDRKIPIECCLTSNVKCGTVKDYDDHHFKYLHERGHPVLICTDDFGVFDSFLSDELVIASETFSLAKSDIQTMLTRSVECSFASEMEMTILQDKINDYFNII